jgi:hypothetical protein
MVIHVTRRVYQLSRSQQVQCCDKLHLHYICLCMLCRSFILFGSLFFPLWFLGDTFRQVYVHGLNVRGGLEKPYDKHMGVQDPYIVGTSLQVLFYVFCRIYDPLVPQTRFSPLLLQFSNTNKSMLSLEQSLAC